MKKEGILSRADLVWIVSTILNNWYLIVFLPSLAWGLAYLYAYKQQDIYAASCQIMLKDEASFQSQFQEQFSKVSSTFSYEYTAGQMRVVKSSDLIERVLDELSLDVRYYIVGRLKVTELYDHMPFKVEFDKRASESYGKRFSVKFLNKEQFELRYDLNEVSKSGIFNFGELITDDGLYLKLESNNDKYYSAIADLDYQFQISPRPSLVSKYKSSLKVNNVSYTSIIEIELADELPARAIDFLTVLSKFYLETTIQNQIEVNQNTQEYIDDLLSEISGVVKGIEYELDSFKVDRNIIDIDIEQSALFARLADLETTVRKTNIELKSLDDLAEYILSAESLKMMMPPSVFLKATDEQILLQLNQLFEARREYVNGLENSTTNNPKMLDLIKEIEQLRSNVLIYKENQEKALKSSLKMAEREIEQIKDKIKYIPAKERELMNIEKKIKVNEGLYDYLLSRRAEVLIARAALVPQTQVIEIPRSKGIIYPDRSAFALKALMIGLGIAAALIFIREFFFRKIRTRMELDNITDLTILGSIPEEKKLDPNFLITSGEDRGKVIQAFRAIRAALQYTPIKSKCHNILVTSLMPGEGKTFASANLASILALADKRVLVVDFDMHKPRLHSVFGVSRTLGLSNYLAGKETIESIIQQQKIKHCHIITAGPVPPNASELVLQKEVQSLIDFADEHYDYLILDTPPTAIISDSLLLMPKMDSNIFVCSSYSTTRTALDHIQKIVDENGLKGLSLLFNKERRTGLDTYYAKYGYGGYGYGGGYEYEYGEASKKS
jgi:tyrosine-protein kinase Etk/Wzc